MSAERSIRQGLLQTRAEYETRNNVLASTLAELVARHVPQQTNRGLDVGCLNGVMTDALASRTNLNWVGIDPQITAPKRSPNGNELLPGWAHELPFPDGHFDCVIFANVYEHVAPDQRLASLADMRRVLVKDGILVGQLPNPYFPIESHSRLPFMGWLPRRAQFWYWRLTPVEWEHDFYVVTIRHLKRTAKQAGFEPVLIRNFNYPLEVIPQSVRWVAKLFERPMRLVPWAWQFAFRKI